MARRSSFIRKLRRKLGVTQEEFALLAGVTSTVVSRWENDHSRPVKRRWELFHDVYDRIKQESESDLEKRKIQLLMASVLPGVESAFQLYNKDELVSELRDTIDRDELLSR